VSVSARRPAAWVAILALIIVSACQKTVADPVDDELFDIDIVEVGVDYRTDVTRLWLRYTPDSYGASSGAAEWTIALADGTPIVAGPHVFVSHSPTGSTFRAFLCTGPVGSGDGFDGVDTVRLTIDNSCLLPHTGGTLPNAIRVSGRHYVVMGQEIIVTDDTGYTDPVGPYP